MSNNDYYKQQNQQQYQQQYQQPQQQEQPKSKGKGSQFASNFFKRLWDSIIFGAGATIGNKIISSICS